MNLSLHQENQSNNASHGNTGNSLTSGYQLPDSFFRQVVENLHDYAVFTSDLSGIINHWTRSAERLTGYTASEILCKNVAALLRASGDSKEEITFRDMEAARQEGSYSCTRQYQKKDGSLLWAKNMVIPLHSEGNVHIGYSYMLQDTTHTIITEQILTEAKDYAISIVETAREPLLVLHSDLTINTANRAFYTMFKVSEEETKNHKIYQIGKGQWNNPKLRELLEEIVPNNDSFSNYEVSASFDGIGEKTLLLNARKLYRPGNHTNMILLAIEDITERKAAQDVKDSFISIASHELKTPITTIKAFAQTLLLKIEETNSEALKYPAKRISELTDKLTTLLTTLLDESMLKSGVLNLRKEQFNITELVSNTIRDFETLSPAYKIYFTPDKQHTVFADKIRIKQVVTNLLSNAIKYSPKSFRVDVSIHEDSVQNLLSVCVADYGIGISQADQRKLFTKFTRASNVLSTNIPGMGLGLHISSEIIKQHNGQLTVTSTEHKGSTFCFTIPVV